MTRFAAVTLATCLLGSLELCAPSAQLARAADRPAAGQRVAAWTIATDDTKLTVGATREGQLCIYELSSPRTAWNWTAEPSVLPLMQSASLPGVANSTLKLQWEFKEGTLDKSDGQRLTLRFTCAKPALELRSQWWARPGRGPVRHAMFLTNNTGAPITIYEQETFDVRLVGPRADTNVWYINDDRYLPDKVGVYCDRLKAGYQKTLAATSGEQDWIPYVVVDSAGKLGAYIGWEWSNGRIAVAAEPASPGAAPNGASLKVGDSDHFRTDLSAGETFEVPPGVLGAYTGDLDDAGNSVRRYLFNYNMPELIRKDTSFPKVEWNAFAATGKKPGSWDPVQKKYYPLIDGIAPLGFEDVVIDIGWWSSYGDPGHIVTDRADWPSGMAAAAKYAHDRGMRFGLYDNEPELLTSEAGKKERISDITFLIKELHADFYRSDATAGPVIQGKCGPGHRAHYPEDVLYWATKGFYEVIDTLHAQIPTFLWENCANGGAIKDFGASRRCMRFQNQDRYYPIDARQSFYDASHVFPPMQIAALVGMWSAKIESIGSVYDFRACSMGAADWHPDAPDGGNGGPVWPEKQRADIKRAVATYKNRLRPLLRNADLYHVFPRPDDKHWDGVQYYDPANGKGVVYVFKPQSSDPAQTVRLKGLDAKAVYRLSFEDGSNPAVTMSGSQLMSDGFRMTLQGTLASELVWIDRN